MNIGRVIIGVAAISSIAAITITGVLSYESKEQPPQKTAQKFRFGELCPDGLRVEYVNTFRLPKSVVCQQPVGDE